MNAPLSARSIADLAGGTILAEIEIAAPPERVFRALTQADEIVRWWGSPEVYQTESWSADLRPGGAWRAGGRAADGTPFSVTGVFKEVAPPSRLVQTWRADWDEGPETVLSYQLEATSNGTRLTLRHDGFGDNARSCQEHAQGWDAVLGWLARHLAPAQDNSFYVLRLIPPRPSFAGDMTPEEATIMQEHVAYWSDHLNQGRALIFGPVADPKGSWGLGVVRVADEAQVRAIEERDPAIRSGKGFRYEVLPMAGAMTAA
jgi:uncharacterized protein YndB with AHSA1/START domain